MLALSRSVVRLAAVALFAATAALPAAAPQPPDHQANPRHGQGAADHMEHRFDNPQELAKRFDDPARDAWQMPERVIDALALKPGMSVADIGAGTGYFAVRLARRSPDIRVYAADVEAAMVDYLRQRAAREKLPNLVAVQAAAGAAQLPKPVDRILVVDTYHHIGNRASYFRSLRASLTPGGKIAIVDFRPDSPDGPPRHFRFTPEQIVSEMTSAGYTLDARHDFLPRQHFLIFR